MRARRPAFGLAFALAFLIGGSAAVPAQKPAEPACTGFTSPRRASIPTMPLPSSYTAARVGGEVVDEVVIGKDGNLVSTRLVHTRLEVLAPFGEASVKKSQFTGGAIEGNPVAVRGLVSNIFGTITKARVEPEYDFIWAYVADGSSREARWQLAESVERLTLTGHIGTPIPGGAEIVARSTSGSEKKLVSLPASSTPIDVRETVETGRFFQKSGDYRLELRSGKKTLAFTTVTIAPDFKSAIVNACAPIP